MESTPARLDVSFNSKHYTIPLSHSGAAGIERILHIQDSLLAEGSTESGEKTLASVISRDKRVAARSKRLLSIGHLISCWTLLLANGAADTAAIMEAHPDDDYSHNVMALAAAILRYEENAYMAVSHNLTLTVVHKVDSELMDNSDFVDKLLKVLLFNATTGSITAARVLCEFVPSVVREMSSLETYRIVRACQRWFNHHFDALAAHHQPSTPDLAPPVLNSLEDLAQYIRLSILRPGPDDNFLSFFEPFQRFSAVYEEAAKSNRQPNDDNVAETDDKAKENDEVVSSSVRKRQSDVVDVDGGAQKLNVKKIKVGTGTEEKDDNAPGSRIQRRGRKPGSVVIGGKVVPPSSTDILVDLTAAASEADKVQVASAVDGEERMNKHNRQAVDSGAHTHGKRVGYSSEHKRSS